MKNKKILTILAAIAFIVSGCTGNTQSSSIAPSTPSTTSEVSSNPSSDTSTSTSSVDSTSATSSNASTSTTTSSSTTSSSSASSSSSSTTSSSYIPSGDTTWNINISLRGAEFRNALQTIMAGKRTRTTTYDNCKALGAILLNLLHRVNVIENTLGQILEELEQVVQVLIHLSLDQHYQAKIVIVQTISMVLKVNPTRNGIQHHVVLKPHVVNPLELFFMPPLCTIKKVYHFPTIQTIVLI